MLCVVYVICGDEHWTALTELNKCYKELKVFVLGDIGLFPLIIPGGLRNHIDGWMLSYLLFVKFVYKNKCSCAPGLCLPSHMYTSFSLYIIRYNTGIIIWTASSEFGTYRLCEQRWFRRACASAHSRQILRCSLIQAVCEEEPSDRKPDPWPL